MIMDKPWRSLSEAAFYLGVHFTTLRRWADRGYIDHMRTPGGKRKFRQDILDNFLSRQRGKHPRRLTIAKLTENAITRTREHMQVMQLAQQNWYGRLTDDQRVRLRSTGNRLVALMLQFSAHKGNGIATLEEGQRIMHEYGDICFQDGLTLQECIQTFLWFRRPMLAAIHETSLFQGMSAQERQRLFERVNLFLDELLVTIVQSYQSRARQTETHRQAP